MTELLEFLKNFKGGEITIAYNNEAGVFLITASRGRFYRTLELVDTTKLDRGDSAVMLSLRAIRLVQEKIREVSDLKERDA